ncbi:MAG: glycosyltransferase [Rhodocyclales bacterium]|nr:glycosyltransferase [Rhodocyclales bacterium]
MADGSGAPSPLLSICIATFNRADFIGETLAAFVPQIDASVEVVIVDGASCDSTPEVVAAMISAHPRLAWRYVRAERNSGVDADYDQAVELARGHYCWLFPDDDLPCPGAVAKLKRALVDEPDVVVVNARFMSPDLSEVLDAPRLKVDDDESFDRETMDDFLAKTIFYLTYIGGCVVRRDFWLARERKRYHGTAFAHIGVICQDPLPARSRLISAPLINYRHGNALWRPRSFEIWMLGWPQLIASLTAVSPRVRLAAYDPSPHRVVQLLSYHLAVGGRIEGELWRRFLNDIPLGPMRPIACALHALPSVLTNFLLCGYACIFMRDAMVVCYDLFTSPNATPATRALARLTRLPAPLLRAISIAGRSNGRHRPDNANVIAPP